MATASAAGCWPGSWGAGLQQQSEVVGGKAVEVVRMRMRITAAGRRAIRE
jgi:hypothetical protein